MHAFGLHQLGRDGGGSGEALDVIAAFKLHSGSEDGPYACRYQPSVQWNDAKLPRARQLHNGYSSH
eukprot:2287760-Amphidinium_carterae.1